MMRSTGERSSSLANGSGKKSVILTREGLKSELRFEFESLRRS